MASLQNSVPVQATAPRKKVEPSTWRPIWPSSRASSAALLVGNVDEDEILRDGGAQRAGAETLSELSALLQLLAGQAAAQHRCADVGEARLALGMDAGVVAEDVVRDALFACGLDGEVEARLKLGEEAFGGPAFLHEEVLHAGAVAADAEGLLIAEDLSDGARSGDCLMRQKECVEA